MALQQERCCMEQDDCQCDAPYYEFEGHKTCADAIAKLTRVHKFALSRLHICRDINCHGTCAIIYDDHQSH